MCRLPLDSANASPASLLPAQTRLQLALDALAGESVSRLAADLLVSRKFVYQQRDKAHLALTAAFDPPEQPDDLLFWLPVTQSWIRQLVLGLVLVCHSSFRGVCELLADLFDHSLSLGSVHNMVAAAAARAAPINASVDLSAIRIAARDEIFQAGQPVLAAADAHSGYCCLPGQVEHRDGDTGGIRLLELQTQKFAPEAFIADFGSGLRNGVKQAMPEVPCRADIFHPLRDFQAVSTYLDNRAYDALKAHDGPVQSAVAQGVVQGYGGSEKNDLLGQAQDAAVSGAISGAFGKGAQVAGDLAGKAVRGTFGVNPQAVKEAAQAGVNLPVSAVSERPTTKLIDRFLTKFPGSIGVMQKATERTLGQIDDEVDRLGGSLAASQQEAGGMIQKGAERYVNRFQQAASKMYDRLDKEIAPATAVPLTNLRKALADEAAPFANNPEMRFLMPASVQNLDQALKGGQDVPYELVKKLRTSVGDKLSKSYLLPDEQQGALKSLYGALTEDMRATAQAQGPQAIKAFDRANEFYKKGAEQIEGAMQKVVANKYPEAVYQAALSGTKQGGSKISGIMKALAPDEKEVLRGTVIKRLGLATPGQQNAAGDLFSVNTYLTNWNAMSPEAKAAIFGGGQYRQAVDRLANVVGRLKDVERYSNVSNTAPYATMGQLMLSAIGGGIVSGPGTSAAIISAAPGGNFAARLMTSPKFVNWLADHAAKPATPTALAEALSRLPRAVGSNPEIQDELKDFVAQFSPGNDQPTNQGEIP